jgi:hypothetical protein
VTTRALSAALYVHACNLQMQLRGKRKKYAKKAWALAKRLPHMPDGAYKGAALAMVVLLLLAAVRAKPKGAA